MTILKKILKWIGYLIAIPILYLVVSIILTLISVNNSNTSIKQQKEIFISTNGVHLDIIIPARYLNKNLKEDLVFDSSDQYLSFGWGDEDFYLNTPTWGDLTFNKAFKAMFLNSSTLIHLTRYKRKNSGWVKIKIDDAKLNKLNRYILKSFDRDETGATILLANQGYTFNDDFYKAIGSYSCLKTCNSWVNEGFKVSELKACYWTPFDFGLINKYK